MHYKQIVKHHFTFRAPYCLGYSSKEVRPDSFNYRIHKNFWCKSHPLDSLYTKLISFIPSYGKSEDVRLEAFRLVINMYYDTMNNGTGNAHKWSVSKEFKKGIRQLSLSKNEIESLERRLSDVFDNMCRGRSFGWVQKYREGPHMEAVESLLTDMVYYTSKILLKDELAELEKIEDPYDLYSEIRKKEAV